MRDAWAGVLAAEAAKQQRDKTPRIVRLGQDGDSVRRFAIEARALWRVPIRVFERSIRRGGVNTSVWVAIMWPKGSAKENE